MDSIYTPVYKVNYTVENTLVVNSCWTPAILMLVAAVPGRDESIMRRSALPKVVP